MGRATAIILVTVILVGGLALVGAASSSGPSDEATVASEAPPTTTTTEPPPAGVTIVRITGGAFRPSNLDVDLTVAPIVQWRHEDRPQFTYVIESRESDENGDPLFISPELMNGDVFEVDFSQFEPDIHRYFSFLGRQRIPGTVDTRPKSRGACSMKS